MFWLIFILQGFLCFFCYYLGQRRILKGLERKNNDN